MCRQKSNFNKRPKKSVNYKSNPVNKFYVNQQQTDRHRDRLSSTHQQTIPACTLPPAALKCTINKSQRTRWVDRRPAHCRLTSAQCSLPIKQIKGNLNPRVHKHQTVFNSDLTRTLKVWTINSCQTITH